MFVMSTQRPSVVVQDKEHNGLYSTFCLCGMIILPFKSGMESGKDGQESARLNSAGMVSAFHLSLKNCFSVIVCSSP